MFSSSKNGSIYVRLMTNFNIIGGNNNTIKSLYCYYATTSEEKNQHQYIILYYIFVLICNSKRRTVIIVFEDLCTESPAIHNRIIPYFCFLIDVIKINNFHYLYFA